MLVEASTQLQISTVTHFMRYSAFYQTIRHSAGLGSAPKVLVFGCSSGEEISTVRAFWPDAEIYGCDIDPEMMRLARLREPTAKIFKSTADEIRQRGPFDLIAANSVLCRHPHTADMAADFPFSTFERMVGTLVASLRENGVLLAYNCSYFIQDTEHSPNLRPINIAADWRASFIYRFFKDGILAAGSVTDGRKFIAYRVRLPLTRAHLSTAIFQKSTLPPATWGAAGEFAEGKPDEPCEPRRYRSKVTTVSRHDHDVSAVWVSDFNTSEWVLHGDFLSPKGKASAHFT